MRIQHHPPRWQTREPVVTSPLPSRGRWHAIVCCLRLRRIRGTPHTDQVPTTGLLTLILSRPARPPFRLHRYLPRLSALRHHLPSLRTRPCQHPASFRAQPLRSPLSLRPPLLLPHSAPSILSCYPDSISSSPSNRVCRLARSRPRSAIPALRLLWFPLLPCRHPPVAAGNRRSLRRWRVDGARR